MLELLSYGNIENCDECRSDEHHGDGYICAQAEDIHVVQEEICEEAHNEINRQCLARKGGGKHIDGIGSLFEYVSAQDLYNKRDQYNGDHDREDHVEGIIVGKHFEIFKQSRKPEPDHSCRRHTENPYRSEKIETEANLFVDKKRRIVIACSDRVPVCRNRQEQHDKKSEEQACAEFPNTPVGNLDKPRWKCSILKEACMVKS